MFIVAMTLLPLRLILAGIWILLLVVFLKLFSLLFCVFDFKKKQNCLFRFLSIGLLTMACRAGLLALGFHWLSYKKRTPNKSNTEYFTNNGNVKNSVIICNHTSYLDILFFLAHPTPVGFISNHNVKKYPIWGYCAQLIQCLFVNRRDKDSRKQCLEDLKKRCDDILYYPRSFNQLVIFPEGTTTDGTVLLDFKKGAFLVENPVKIMHIEYGKRFFDQNLNFLSVTDNVVLTALQFYNTLTYTELDGSYYPTTFTGWEEFAKETRLLMSREFNMELSDITYAERQKFEKDNTPKGYIE
jgi:lysophosphatidylcholine acyltransferase/lyso-PAF acetyltransferase